MPRITYPNDDAWLADRPQRIGASESPGILGYGFANESRMATYAKKIDPTLDEVIDATLAERFALGHLMEPVIVERFRQVTGLDVRTYPTPMVCVSDERPHIAATLDGEVETIDGPAVFQAKNVSEFAAADWEDGSLPMRVQIQTQHEMYASGHRFAFIAALIGGNRLVWKQTERDDRFLAAMLPVLDEFWRHVQSRTPPPVDGSAATAEALRRLYRQDDGETVALPIEAVQWDTDLQAIKAEIKEAEARRTALENKIKAEIKGATYGAIPGGGRYSWKTSERNEKAREARVIQVRTLWRLKQ